jgi:hypothetical protein
VGETEVLGIKPIAEGRVERIDVAAKMIPALLRQAGQAGSGERDTDRAADRARQVEESGPSSPNAL